MSWQVRYALANISGSQLTGEHVGGELIRITAQDQPEVWAVISAEHEICAATAERYRTTYPEMDFLCGYRKSCVWHGEAIEHLESVDVGWGSCATLASASLEGNANTASHKTYFFSDRLLRQYGRVQNVCREYDRIHRVTLRSGTVLRIAMIADYEPTADAIRSLVDQFGRVDIVWNINPNGHPSPEAIAAGIDLGCEVMKWEELKERLRTT
ncbi:MAG: hypothetical protein QM576_11585 [Rhodopseudomonas sp.]|uniref:hypothetical protein n=1 Tax=Rhodopseudomonas sp. TaxID=1078 RepID=UPI0039E25AFD